MKENTPDSWAALKRATRIARCKYFDRKVEEVASENKRPWDLMNWVGSRNTLFGGSVFQWQTLRNKGTGL